MRDWNACATRLTFFPTRQYRLKMRRLFFGGHDADFNFLETRSQRCLSDF
jgi:hypothetical protein